MLGNFAFYLSSVVIVQINLFFKIAGRVSNSCRTATLEFFFDLAESKVAVFLCSILTNDGVPFCFGKNSFP